MAKSGKKKSPAGELKLKIGQKIFHPFYGVGTVVKKNQEKKILGETRKFSVFKFKNKNLQIMVEMDNKSMIHELISKDELPGVIGILKEGAEKLPRRSYQRYKSNLKKIKSGNIYEIAEVLRDLTALKKKKKRLSKKERKLYESAKEVFCDTISHLRNVTYKEAEKILSEAL